MPYTFEEAMAWWLVQETPEGSVLVADVMIVRTQDDGRTGYMAGFFGTLIQGLQDGDSFRGGGLVGPSIPRTLTAHQPLHWR